MTLRLVKVVPLERQQMCRHILARPRRSRKLVSAAPLFITENGHSWLLYLAKPPDRRAEFIYAHSSAFIPGLKTKHGLFFLPSALGVITKSLQYKDGESTVSRTFVSAACCDGLAVKVSMGSVLLRKTIVTVVSTNRPLVDIGINHWDQGGSTVVWCCRVLERSTKRQRLWHRRSLFTSCFLPTVSTVFVS